MWHLTCWSLQAAAKNVIEWAASKQQNVLLTLHSVQNGGERQRSLKWTYCGFGVVRGPDLIDGNFSVCLHRTEGSQVLSKFTRALISFMKVPPSGSHYLPPKMLLQMSWGLGFNLWIMKVYIHIVAFCSSLDLCDSVLPPIKPGILKPTSQDYTQI